MKDVLQRLTLVQRPAARPSASRSVGPQPGTTPSGPVDGLSLGRHSFAPGLRAYETHLRAAPSHLSGSSFSASAEPQSKVVSKVATAAVLMAVSGAVGTLFGGSIGELGVQQQLVTSNIQNVENLDSARPSWGVRQSQPVRTSSVEEVVSRFNKDQGLYVVGTPSHEGSAINGEVLRDFQKLVEEHPNVYVVLVDTTNNHERDNRILSEGIGESAAFRSVTREGESDGVLFLMYFNTESGQRRLNMRSESLPDRLSVGESQFASGKQGTPGPLMDLFRDRISRGETPGEGLDAVADVINATISQHLERTPEEQRAYEEKLESARDSGRLTGAGIGAAAGLGLYVVGGLILNAPAGGGGGGSHYRDDDYYDSSSGSDGSTGSTW